MIKLHDLPVLWTGGAVREATPAMAAAREKTMACRILRAHTTGSGDGLQRLAIDSLISHDITYVGVIQTAKASGLTEFPVPYVLTNCHNSLCAAGDTIYADDHAFGLSAAVKYGGDYVPANQAVIHQYAREMLAGCGKMVRGSDSHTRYGALGTLGVGEGGGEIVKQLLRNTYDLAAPQVVLVHVTGRPRHGVGPHDVAIALCGAVYKNGFVKNKVLEFVGDGIGRLSMDYRIGIAKRPAGPPSGRLTAPCRTIWRCTAGRGTLPPCIRRTARTMTALSSWTCPPSSPWPPCPSIPPRR